MPGIPGQHDLTKGGVSEAIDAALNESENGGFPKRTSILAALEKWEDPRGLAQILYDENAINEAQMNILLGVWHGRTQGVRAWWPEIQPIEPVMRESFIQAIRLANFELPDPNDPDKPLVPLTVKRWIDSYWICADHFEVVLTRSEKQVNRLMFTPDAPVNTPANPMDRLREIIYVRPGSVAEHVLSQEQHPHPDPRYVVQVDVIQVKHR